MLTLNLLTPQARQIIAYERYRRAALALVVSVGAALTIFAVLLLPTFFFITFYENELARQLEMERASAKRAKLDALESLAADINGLAGRILAEEQKSRIYPVVSEVVSAIPEGLTISSLRLSVDKKNLVIDGQAETRDIFLEAIKRLRDSPSVSNVVSPLSNIIRERDITFSLNISIR